MRLAVFCITAGSGLCRAQIAGGMVDPAIDKPGEPFSYFWHPTDVIGAPFARVASEVTPEGFIYNGFGDLMFFTGNPPKPVDQRVKVLEKGYLPIVHYDYGDGGILYSFTVLAADLGGALKGLPVNFVRIEVRNTTSEARTAFLTSGFRSQAPTTTAGHLADFRFSQRFDLMPAEFTTGQTQFSSKWRYQLGVHDLVRDGSILYDFSGNPEFYSTAIAQRDGGFRLHRFLSGEVEGDLNPSLDTEAQPPLGMVMYRLPLSAGQTVSLYFKMPVTPIPESSPAASLLEFSDFDSAYRKVVDEWTDLVGKHSPFSIPEEKVQQSLLANSVDTVLAIDKVGDEYIPNVNKFQYHTFYPTDTSLMSASLDDMGLSDLAGKMLMHAITRQAEDGSLAIEKDLWETFGHVLWAWDRHYWVTQDKAFLDRVYPAVRKAMEHEIATSARDPLGITPVATVFDDAQLKGAHQTGQSIWTLIGLEAAVRMAKASGHGNDATAYEAERKRFRTAFDKALAEQTAKSGGYVPPALDKTLQGNPWDNLHLLYPAQLFAPSDPRVTASIAKVRSEYREGLLTFIWPMAKEFHNGNYQFDDTPLLHYWHSPDIAQNQIVRGFPGDQEAVVKDLYALLVHTTSTHATQEFGTLPWGTRDPLSWNILPDGSTSAVLVELVRNMLVRESADELHLFSVVSPAWAAPGKSIRIDSEATSFGPVTATAQYDDHGFTVDVSNAFWKQPSAVVIHIPWYFQAASATVDGQATTLTGETVVFPPTAKRVRITGSYRPQSTKLSFAQAVDDYKAEYARHYAHFLKTGELLP